MGNKVEKIVHDDELIAIIIQADYRKDGIEFFTSDNYSQQLAYMKRPAGYKIEPHVHNRIRREVLYTQEVLFIRKGKVKVDFYNSDLNFIDSQVLHTGDVILLASGGHAFEILEETEMIEVKQGPYAGEEDKIRFSPLTKITSS